MRRRILLIVFSCILLILSLVIFDRINARNAAPMPVPSVSGGYYENGFTLRLTAPSTAVSITPRTAALPRLILRCIRMESP